MRRTASSTSKVRRPAWRRPRRALLVLAALGLTACDEGDGGLDVLANDRVEITLSPLSLTLTPGATGEVQVHVIRIGHFDGAVAIGVSALPPGVSVTSLDLEPSEVEGTLVFTAAGTTAPAEATVTVRASAPSVDDAAASLALTILGP